MSLEIKSLEHLFISKVRIKALKYFMLHQDTSIHLRGAVRELNEEINAVRRELTRLEEMKIIISENKGNRKYFITNKEHPFRDQLTSLIHKSYGLGGEITEANKKLGEIEFSFLTPAYTKGDQYGVHPIDLVLIGKIDLNSIEELVQKYQNEIGREIHYTIMQSSEFQIRKRRRDQFIQDLIIQDIVMLIGRREDLIS